MCMGKQKDVRYVSEWIWTWYLDKFWNVGGSRNVGGIINKINTIWIRGLQQVYTLKVWRKRDAITTDLVGYNRYTPWRCDERAWIIAGSASASAVTTGIHLEGVTKDTPPPEAWAWCCYNRYTPWRCDERSNRDTVAEGLPSYNRYTPWRCDESDYEFLYQPLTLGYNRYTPWRCDERG